MTNLIIEEKSDNKERVKQCIKFLPKDIYLDYHSIVKYNNHIFINTLAGNTYLMPKPYEKFYNPIIKYPALNCSFTGYNLHFEYGDKWTRVSMYGSPKYSTNKKELNKRFKHDIHLKDLKSDKPYSDKDRIKISKIVAKRYNSIAKIKLDQ